MAGNKFVAVFMDKLKLIFTAIAGLSAAGIVVCILDNIGLTKLWKYFVMGCLVYIITTYYLIVIQKSLRNKQLFSYFLLMLIMAIPISISYYIFYYDVIIMPESLVAYSLPTMILAPGTVIIFEKLSKSMKMKAQGKSKLKI